MYKYLLKNNDILFYSLVFFTCISILFTNPFLRYPYDMIHHLLHIDRFYTETTIPTGRWIWHFIWAKFFYIFDIPNSEIFFRAKVIHIIQTFIAFFSVYYFSKVVIRNIFIDIDIDNIVVKYLSFWSVVIWFSIFATFSMNYQMVWNMWYSVNYQITLPLFWYITGLTLALVFENSSWKIKIFFAVQILLISRFILQAHSMEYLYYLMYIFVFAIVYIDKLIYILKKYYYILIPSIIVVVIFAKKYQPENSLIFNYFNISKLPELLFEIDKQGKYIVTSGLNRAFASINELMYIIFFIGIITVLLLIINRQKSTLELINTRRFIFILLTSFFLLIPLYEFSAGLFAIITRDSVVNRIYYSSSIFVLLPIFVYSLFYLKEKRAGLLKLNITLILILSSVWMYSKYISSTKLYYQNITSIKNSFIEREVGFNLSKEQIDKIGMIINNYEKDNSTEKKLFYYARADISFVIKYIFRKNVYWIGRRANPDYIDIYESHVADDVNNEYKLLLFETPKGFPEYEPYK